MDLPPLNLLLARRLMERTRIYKILQGYRNIPPANLDLLEEILVRLSQLVTDFPEIVELDINPLSVISGRFVGGCPHLLGTEHRPGPPAPDHRPLPQPV